MRRFTAFALFGLIISTAPALAQSAGTMAADEQPAARPQTPATGCGFLGVYPNDVRRRVNGNGVQQQVRGAIVVDVVKETGAARAGVLKRDIITGFNGETITSEAQLRRLIMSQTPGTWVRLDIRRGEQTLTVNAEITSRSKYFPGTPDCSTTPQQQAPPQLEQRMRDAVKDLDLGHFELRELDGEMLRAEAELARAKAELESSVATFRIQRNVASGYEGNTGLGLQRLSEQLSEYFNTGSTRGALVNEVADGSPALRAGVQAGDVIVDVNGKAINGPMDAVEGIVQDTDGTIDLRVIRDGQERAIQIRTGGGSSDAARPQSAPNMLPDIGSNAAPQREHVRLVGQDLQ